MAVKKTYVHKPSMSAIPIMGTDVGWDTNLAILSNTAWYEACVVDIDFDGSYEEEDVTDSCSDDFNESVPTSRNSEMTFHHFFKLDATGAVPQWAVDIRDAWFDKEVLMVMMLNDALTTTAGQVSGAPPVDTLFDGLVLLGNVLNYRRSHPVKGAIRIEYSLKAAGVVTGMPKLRFIEYPTVS